MTLKVVEELAYLAARHRTDAVRMRRASAIPKRSKYCAIMPANSMHAPSNWRRMPPFCTPLLVRETDSPKACAHLALGWRSPGSISPNSTRKGHRVSRPRAYELSDRPLHDRGESNPQCLEPIGDVGRLGRLLLVELGGRCSLVGDCDCCWVETDPCFFSSLGSTGAGVVSAAGAS